MRLEADTSTGSLVVTDDDGVVTETPLYSKKSFERLSDLWVTVGWNEKYPYTFSWLGRPVIQLPEDMIRLQEVVAALQPDVVVETGVAHGGSAVFLASLCRALGRGRVVAVDIEIRPHNRAAIEAHPLADLITLVEGSSTDPEVVARVRSETAGAGTVLVILDSDHSHDHVLAELEAYGPLVSTGSWVVATDGVMRQVAGAPRGKPGWTTDNPEQAAQTFLRDHPEFVLEQPRWPFNESELDSVVTHWPGAWLRRT
jgi:cephalosporin hydroxylase